MIITIHGEMSAREGNQETCGRELNPHDGVYEAGVEPSPPRSLALESTQQ